MEELRLITHIISLCLLAIGLVKLSLIEALAPARASPTARTKIAIKLSSLFGQASTICVKLFAVMQLETLVSIMPVSLTPRPIGCRPITIIMLIVFSLTPQITVAVTI